MRIYDLSPEISEEMIVYKNKLEKKPKLNVTRMLKEGANESRLEIESHTGSHLDAPYHVLGNGKTIEKISLDKFIGEAVVLDFTKVKDCITKKDLQHLKIQKNDIVLLKTKNKQGKAFDFNFIYLEKNGA